MKTKYILHGGYAGHPNSQNDAFFSEMLKDSGDSVNVLIIFFAKEEDRIPKNRDESIAQFERNKGSKIINYNTATEDLFLKQVAWADVIYIHGGTTLKLLEALRKFKDLSNLFEKKTIGGESAGAYVLSSHFYSEKAGGMFEGLGLIPVSTICHYTDARKDFVKDFPVGQEILLLPDYTYRVFED